MDHGRFQLNQMNLLNTIFLSAIFTCSCWLAQGCSQVRPDPLAPYSPTALQKNGVSYLKIEATLRNEAGENIRGVDVSIETQSSKAEATTASTGRFFADVLFAAGDIIDFHFHAKDVEWTETLRDIPRAVEKVTLRFVLLKNHTIRLTAIEY